MYFQKIKPDLKNAVLIVSVFTICMLFVTSVFGVSEYDGAWVYSVAGTVLIIYFHENRRTQ